MSNDNILDFDTGRPNFSNPRVLAGFIDMIGMSLTQTLNHIGQTGTMCDTDALELVSAHRMLRKLREGIGADHDFGMENQSDVVDEITAAMVAHQAAQDPDAIAAKIAKFRENAQAVGLPADMVEEYLTKIIPQETPAQAAERLLREI